jgi:hypothetical protein
MAIAPSPPLTQKRLITCILINLLATPGLGSLMARRIISGIGQLILALVGCGLLGAWLFELMYRMVLRGLDETTSSTPPWMLTWGLISFAVSWFWSLVTCSSLWSEAKKLNAPPVANIPPRIS